jgi:hypothetical protein
LLTTVPFDLWRIWAWTTDGIGTPEGILHSDSRYAFTEPS